MTNREVILKSINFIENNLRNEITVMDISKEVCYSLYHFIRLFQNVTGFSPKAYLQQRRLSEAANDLMKTNKKIIDIAFDYQFGSHESFTRAFRKHLKSKPIDIRNGNTLSAFPLLCPITEDFVNQADKTKNKEPEIIKLEEIKLIGISVFVKDNDKGIIITELWAKFLNQYNEIKNRIIPEKFYQVQFWSNNQELNGLFFFIGVEVDSCQYDSLSFVSKIIPKAKYLRFIHKGFSNKVGYTYKYIYNQFLPDTDYKLTLPYNFEYYGKRYKGPYNENSESEIYIPVE